MGIADRIPVWRGSEEALVDEMTPQDSQGARKEESRSTSLRVPLSSFVSVNQSFGYRKNIFIACKRSSSAALNSMTR